MRQGSFEKNLSGFEMSTPTFNKKSNYEKKRATARVYVSTKQTIENIVGNRRDRVKIQEFANASEIYEMLYHLIDEDFDKLSFVIKALKHYFKDDIDVPNLLSQKDNQVTVKIFKTSKFLIENTMNNDRNKTYTDELYKAVQIYAVVYYTLGEDTENKKDILYNIITDYKKSYA